MRGLLNGVAVLFFPRGADASVGGEESSGYVANSIMAGFALSGYALRAHQTRTMKIGDITRGEAGFARPFRLSSMAKYSFRKKMLDPRLARDCDCARAMECGSCASRAHMRRPEGFPRRRLRYLRDSGLGNALQINPSPLQRSYNTLAKPAICSGKTLFPPNGRVGHPYRTLGAMRSVAGKTARSEKIRLSAQNEMRVAAARIRAFLGFLPAAGAPDFAGRGREPAQVRHQSRLSSARLPPPCFEGEDISILSSEPGLTSLPASMSASVIFAIRISCFLYPPREWS